MGSAMDAKPEQVARLCSLAVSTIESLDSSSISILAPLSVHKQYSLLQTTALAYKGAGARVLICGMEYKYAAHGLQLKLDSKLALSSIVPSGMKCDLVVVLGSDVEEIMKQFAEGTPLITSKTNFTKIGVTPDRELGSFAAGRAGRAGRAGGGGLR